MKKQPIPITFIFPVMFYYIMEAAIVSLFITLIGKLLLADIVGDVSYFQWMGIYWIFKMLFFDVFKLISGINAPEPQDEENEENSLS